MIILLMFYANPRYYLLIDIWLIQNQASKKKSCNNAGLSIIGGYKYDCLKYRNVTAKLFTFFVILNRVHFRILKKTTEPVFYQLNNGMRVALIRFHGHIIKVLQCENEA